MQIKFKVSKSMIEQPVLSLSETSSPELKALYGEVIFLRVGLSRFQVKLAPPISGQEYCELLFPEEHPYKIEYCCRLNTHFSIENRTLSFGPVIGILTDAEKSGKPVLGRLETYYNELHRFTQIQGGLFFITGTASLKQSEGWVYSEETSEWIQVRIPVPDTLYNRIHSRRSDCGELMKNLIMGLEDQSAFVFNTSYLTKDYVHEQLSKEDHLLEYLPHTETYSLASLKRMIDQHQDLFIKHIAGSQGKKLLRLTYLEKEFLLFQNMQEDAVKMSFPSLQVAYEELSNLKVSSNFIIQETIPLLKSRGRALDFRFLCHLVDRNEWKLISAVARISGEGQFVSNIAKGGELAKPLTMLHEFFSRDEARKIFMLMKETALTVCCRLAENSSLTLGELGVDLGLDATGKPWLIEVNSKPSKQTYADNISIRPSVKALHSLSTSIWEERRT
jgi:hypothetical protein